MKLYKIFILVCLLCSLTACGQKIESAKGGTYLGTFNLYSKSVNKYVKDTNYVRIKFINDSIFAFTISEIGLIGKTEAIKSLSFNNNLSSGIAKLILSKEQKIWVGILDLGQGSGYFNNKDEQYYNVDSVLNIQQAYDTIPPQLYPYNQYNILRFSFLGKNSLSIKVVKKVAGRFNLAESYAKIDDKDLGLTIGSGFHFNEASKQYNDNDDSSVMLHDCVVKLLPIEMINNDDIISGKLKKGDRIYLGTRYMKYVFVYQIDDKHNYSNYGWVKRSAIVPINRGAY